MKNIQHKVLNILLSLRITLVPKQSQKTHKDCFATRLSRKRAPPLRSSALAMTERGFSILEIVMYMGILSVLLFMFTDIFVSMLDVRSESLANSSVVQDARFMLSRFSYDIKRAQTISQPANLGDSSNSLQLSIDGDAYTYSLTNGTLNLQNINGVNAVNSVDTTVSNLVFKKLGNTGGKPSVRITFTLTSVIQRKSGYETRNYQTTVGTR